jgi:hypothetical protein
MKPLLAVAFSALAVLDLSASAFSEPPSFARKPTVARVGNSWKINFEVSSPTDVEVTVLDGQQKVIRHLAAGVLGGPNPPPKPLRPGLVQSLAWDGNDDRGRPVKGESLTVRVRLGMKPEFDSFLLYNPDASPEIQSLAIGPRGEVYAFYDDPTANGNQGGLKLKVLDRQARHLRQIVPYPADMPYDRIKATGAFQDRDGNLVPHCHNWHSLNFYPDTVAARGRSMSPFSQPVMDGRGRVHWIINDGRLCSLDSEGGVPYETFFSAPLFPDLKDPERGRPALALSSDGKHLYAAGIHAGIYDRSKPVPCVFRIDLSNRTAEVFLGKIDQSGKAKDLFVCPRGVAVARGLLYVADPGADRIAVFQETDRKLVGEMKITLPHLVQVHPATGAVYVCAYVPEAQPSKDGKCRIKDANLLKYEGYKAGEPVCQLALPRTGLSPNDGTHRIALDANADPPLLWAPGLPYARGGARRLACYRDTGKALEPVELPEIAKPWGDGPRDLLVDRQRGELYVKVQGEQWHQYDEATGALLRTVLFPKERGGPYMASSGAQLGVDSAGNYITHCWGDKSGLMRWSRDLKPLNWLGQDTHRTDWGGMMTFQLKYMALRNDEIYVIKPVTGPHHLDVYDMGLKHQRRVVWNVRRGSCPRVDAQGNIYVTVPIRPVDRDFPEFFDGKLNKLPDYFRRIGDGHYWYTYMYGCIVKFPPEGGAFHWIETDRDKNDLTGLPETVRARPKQKFQYFQHGHYPHKLCEVQGAEWVRFGFAPYSETYGAGTPVCMCEGSGFDVDPFGRVFYPNLCQFRVEVIDNSNNFIASFGHYGNQDSGGKDAKVRKPKIPLAWPTYVAVSDRHAYVNDTIGMRVVRVRLACQREECCKIASRVGADSETAPY